MTYRFGKSVMILVAAAAAALPFVANPNGLPVYDDTAIFQANEFVRTGAFFKIWSTPYWAGVPNGQNENLFRPVFLSVAALFAHQHFVLMRLCVAVLHAVVGGLLFGLLMREAKRRWHLPERRAVWLSLFGASLFLFSAAQVETTAQGIGLMEVGPALLGLTAFAVINSQPWIAVLLAALAPGLKETGFVWLLGVTLTLAVRRQKLQTTVASAFIGVWLYLRYLVYGSVLDSSPRPYSLLNPMVDYGAWDGLMTRLALLGHHLRIFFVPVGLSSDYSRGTLPIPGYLIQVWVLLALAFLCLLWRRRRQLPPEAWCAMATVLPTLGILGNLVTLFAERFGYTMRIGLVVLATQLLLPVARSRRRWLLISATGIAVCALGWFATLSFKRHALWRSGETLFAADVAAYPANAKTHFNFGTALGAARKWREAQAEFLTSLSLAPDFPEAHYRLGAVYNELGEFDDAQRHWLIAKNLGYPVD